MVPGVLRLGREKKIKKQTTHLENQEAMDAAQRAFVTVGPAYFTFHSIGVGVIVRSWKRIYHSFSLVY